MILQKLVGRPVDKIILHCAAVPGNWWRGETPVNAVAEIRRWHRDAGYDDIGYHYVVWPDGLRLPGRDVSKIGAHVKGHNTGSIGVLLIESAKIDRIGHFYDFFSEAQRRSVAALAKGYGITDIRGHNDFNPRKLCPGFKVDPAFFAA